MINKFQILWKIIGIESDLVKRYKDVAKIPSRKAMNASVNVIGRCKIEKSAADRHILMKRLNFSSNLLKIIPLNIASSAIAVNRVIPIMNKVFVPM